MTSYKLDLASTCNVNGVNVIGLALQGPSMPSIAVLHHNGPYNLQPCIDDTDTSNSAATAVAPLQPRPATTGSADVLPLQPRLLPNFCTESGLRETRSEPREILPLGKSLLPDYSPAKIMETELGLASASAIAIGSSTEVLVSILENQAGFRRNSFLSVSSQSPVSSRHRASPVQSSVIAEADPDEEAKSSKYNKTRIVECNETELKSPDYEFVKSPSTELTNPSDQSSPTEAPRDTSCFSLDAHVVPNTSNSCDTDLKSFNQPSDIEVLHATYL
ncbi:hypothetical protein ILUMI_05474 [Ignelater luminosus]|uniref:Uncharacterized protein n=1 Tax=Ignelater luminosus TaxID=2038154 RepID=A0A8K0DC85_IGNLU|nr:hypothetical protein ILUMI_05474 [Ignelater luminosus]